MNTRNSEDRLAHSNTFHQQQLALFDAYQTSELDEDEKAQVEQYLKSCQECQRLFADVTHVRHQLETLRETEKATGTERELASSSHILHAVMASIEPEKKAGNGAQQASTLPHTLRTSLPVRKRTWSISLRLIAATLCLFLLTGLILTIHTMTNTPTLLGVPSPITWTTQKQSLLIQNSDGVFAVKYIDITMQKEFHFYYVFKSSHQGTLHVTAISALSAGQGPDITLSTTVQPLGMIDSYNIGVIRVKYLNRVGQTITLHILSPVGGNIFGQLSPLKQLLAEPHPDGKGSYGLFVDQNLFSEIIWAGPAGPSPRSSVAFFKDATGAYYIFLQVDYLGNIRVITREECIQLDEKQNCH